MRPEPPVPKPPPPVPDVHPAIGPLTDLSEAERRLYVDPGSFPPLGEVRKNWWRDRVAERGQTFPDYAVSVPNPPHGPRNRLYLLPIGTFPLEFVTEAEYVVLVRSAPLDWLGEFLERFYGLPVTVMDPRDLDELGVEFRERKGHRQYNARALLSAVAPMLPADAYSMTALINRDMYFLDEQEYAFGYGLHYERRAALSFAQFDPMFMGRVRPDSWQRDIDRRSLMVLAHEVGHTFGLRHCTFYACALNGMSHPREVDETPLRLCPVCLRKLASLETVDPVDRYRELGAFYEQAEMHDEAHWITRRLEYLRADVSAQR